MFRTNFITHIDILDLIRVSYESSPFDLQSVWDVNNWGDDGSSIASTDLIWDASQGDALKLLNEEFNLLKIDINLDTLQTTFSGRET